MVKCKDINGNNLKINQYQFSTMFYQNNVEENQLCMVMVTSKAKVVNRNQLAHSSKQSQIFQAKVSLSLNFNGHKPK